MIATLYLLTKSDTGAAYKLEIPNRRGKIIEIGPADLQGLEYDFDEVAIKKSMALLELLEYDDVLSVKLIKS